VRVLVVGASGLIGTAITARLLDEGHSVLAVGRTALPPRPGLQSFYLDLRSATDPKAWTPLLANIDVVINAAGVLQDGGRDSTDAAHGQAPRALFAACASVGIKRVIHFSAVGVDRATPSPFSASKAKGDHALRESTLDYVILRPSVVLGDSAYGASALMRGLAWLPLSLRVGNAGALQVVQLSDVIDTVVRFLDPASPARVEIELVGPDRFSFDQLVARYRQWLGWPPARTLAVPERLMRWAYRLGDFAGWLGWRSPMRSNAAAEIVRGATGDAAVWTQTTGIAPRSLEQALASRPAPVQEKWFARLYLLKPLIFTVFSLFWIATGIISLGPGWDIGVGLMHEGGVTGPFAALTVIAGALADFCIGLAIAFRRTSKFGLYAALAISLAYVVIGTILVPRLWIDPLGPMLKIWPVLALNLAAIAILEDR
jgi:uncharacterized protein YbjT (DUF2867 family)